MTVLLPLTLAVAFLGLVRTARPVLVLDDITVTAEEIQADLDNAFERGPHRRA